MATLELEGGGDLEIEGGSALLIEGDYNYVAVDTPLGAITILGAVQVDSYVQVDSPLGAATLLGNHNFGYVQVSTPLGSVAILGWQLYGQVAVDSPLGAVSLVGYNDFTTGIPDYAVISYVMDLTTPGGDVRVPISSWQATLQVDRSNYVQCVVPGSEDWVDDINDATAFTISRVVTFDDQVIEYPMAVSTLDLAQFSKGPHRYTCTLSGYDNTYTADPDPDTTYDRTLEGIRSLSTGSGIRARCKIDFLLRPAQRAYADGQEIIVDYINYYVNESNEYMDVGERG